MTRSEMIAKAREEAKVRAGINRITSKKQKEKTYEKRN